MSNKCECDEVKFTFDDKSPITSVQVELFGYDGIAFIDRREQENLLKFLFESLRKGNENIQTIYERTL